MSKMKRGQAQVRRLEDRKLTCQVWPPVTNIADTLNKKRMVVGAGKRPNGSGKFESTGDLCQGCLGRRVGTEIGCRKE